MSNRAKTSSEVDIYRTARWRVWGGLCIAAVVVSAWGAYVHDDNPAASWGDWGGAFEPVTGLLSAIAVAVAFVAMWLQTHELKAQQIVMRDQLDEAKAHRSELEQQRVATSRLSDAMMESNSLAERALLVDCLARVSDIYAGSVDAVFGAMTAAGEHSRVANMGYSSDVDRGKAHVYWADILERVRTAPHLENDVIRGAFTGPDGMTPSVRTRQFVPSGVFTAARTVVRLEAIGRGE